MYRGAISVGYSNEAGVNGISIGGGAKARQFNSIVVGRNTVALHDDRNNSIAIGAESGANGNGTISVGYKAENNGSNSIVIGNDIKNYNHHVVGIGGNVGSTWDQLGENTISLGYNSKSNGKNSIAIGYGAVSAYDRSVTVGKEANNQSKESILIGANSTIGTNSEYSVVIGVDNKVNNSNKNSLIIGSKSTSNAPYSITIGHDAVNNYSGSVAFKMAGDLKTYSRLMVWSGTVSNSNKTHLKFGSSGTGGSGFNFSNNSAYLIKVYLTGHRGSVGGAHFGEGTYHVYLTGTSITVTTVGTNTTNNYNSATTVTSWGLENNGGVVAAWVTQNNSNSTGTYSIIGHVTSLD
jgi:hypothetical protein